MSLRFPFTPGTSIQSIDRKGLNLGEDLDGDGKNETVNLMRTVHVDGHETITVPAGNYQSVLKVRSVVVSTVIASSNAAIIKVTQTHSIWLAPGIGPVRIHDVTETEGFSESYTEELVEFIPAFRFTSLSVEGLNGCGTIVSGEAYCWGNNSSGQIGNGTTSIDARVPVPIASGLFFTSLSPGCGVVSGGQGYCWGNNDFGQLGNGTVTQSPSPVPVTGGLSFSRINTPAATSCGITIAGKAYCWGGNSNGSLGNGSDIGSLTPVPVSGNLTFSSLSPSGDFVCAVTTAGRGYCWGDNQWGQLGNGLDTDSNVPVPVSGDHVFSLIKITNASACGLTTDNDLYCWGINHNGEFGNGTMASGSFVPVPAASGLKLVTFDAGANSYCGLTSTGVAYCWGFGLQGQLGNGFMQHSSIPVLVNGGHLFVLISAGLSACGLTTEGAAYCWGSNTSGELGNPTVGASSSVPMRVFPPAS